MSADFLRPMTNHSRYTILGTVRPAPEEVTMGQRLLGLAAILSVLACVACTSTGGSVPRAGQTRPDCPTDYLYGQKVTPCYYQR